MFGFVIVVLHRVVSLQLFTYSKSTAETLEKSVKYVQS